MVESSLSRLKEYIEESDYLGYDPYDALESPLLRFLTFRRKYLRIAAIQALKRSPINIRTLLGIKRGLNPKGLGLFLWGYSKLFSAKKNERYLERTDVLIDLLEQLKSDGYSGNSWGYNFDWQSRAFFVPKFTPTVVNSSFIGHALLDTYMQTGNERALSMALPIADFITSDLNRHYEGSAFCFSYTPTDRYFVHNANILGSSILARLYRHTRNNDHLEASLQSLEYSMRHQRDDGSWYYAERKGSRWIDSFHTGFNLQCLKYTIDEGLAAEYSDALENGVAFYTKHFFLSDGTPRYYHDRTYPIDIHAPSQALVLFSLLGDKYRRLADITSQWMIENLQDDAGFFYFQIRPFYKNRIPYIRWSQAWAFHALTSYLLQHNL